MNLKNWFAGGAGSITVGAACWTAGVVGAVNATAIVEGTFLTAWAVSFLAGGMCLVGGVLVAVGAAILLGAVGYAIVRGLS